MSSKGKEGTRGAGHEIEVGFPLLPWPGIGPKAFLHSDARPIINGANTACVLDRLIINTRARDQAKEDVPSLAGREEASITQHSLPPPPRFHTLHPPTHTHRGT